MLPHTAKMACRNLQMKQKLQRLQLSDSFPFRSCKLLYIHVREFNSFEVVTYKTATITIFVENDSFNTQVQVENSCTHTCLCTYWCRITLCLYFHSPTLINHTMVSNIISILFFSIKPKPIEL